MIEIDKKASPYLVGLAAGVSICTLSGLEGMNELCGFYQDELTKKNKKDYISYQRLFNAVAWLSFSFFSGYSCYLLGNAFLEPQTAKVDLSILLEHKHKLDRFQVFFSDRYREKNSLRNLCWNCLQSDQALQVLQEGQGLGTSFESTIKYAYEAFNTIEREADELKRQVQALSSEFMEDTTSLREQIESYEVAKGVRVNLINLCDSPYGWFQTELCQLHTQYKEQRQKYSLYEAEVEVYKRDIYNLKSLEQCRQAYSIQSDIETLYDFGKKKSETEKNTSLSYFKKNLYFW